MIIAKQTAELKAPTILDTTSIQNDRYFFFINGINLKKNAYFDWHLNAARWVQSDQCPERWQAEPFSYQVSALDRWLHQQSIINSFAQVLGDHVEDKSNDRVTLCGHSNGCAVICGVLRQNPTIKVDELHLIAAAAQNDFVKNGLGRALSTGQVNQVFLHCSHADSALAWAKRTRWLGWFNSGWEYGWMGLDGPVNTPTIYDGKCTIWYPGYDHSSYFEPLNFDHVMHRVINHGIV
jgi:pimeloyl-ACP methyl ester carboxylesterase